MPFHAGAGAGAGAWWLQPQAVPPFSFGMAALTFLLLCVAALRRRPAPLAGHLALASLVTAAWSLMSALAAVAVLLPQPNASRALQPALFAPLSITLIDILETVRTAAWLLLLVALGGAAGQRRRWAWSVALAVAVQWFALVSPSLEAAHLAMLRVALAVGGMMLAEQAYRGAPVRARWAIKLACLGIGGLFAYDFYLYADALLLRRLDGDIVAARGAVDALCAPLVWLALRRSASWAPRMQLSQQIMYRSVALLGGACYLLAMAGGAWYLRAVGGAWGPPIQLACIFGAVMLLAVVMFSGAVRARLTVWVGKHFFRSRYDYREQWERFTRGLGADNDTLSQRSIEALANLVESPAGTLWLRRESAAFAPAAAWNLPLPTGQLEADSALCQALEQRQWVVDVAAWRQRNGLAGDRTPTVSSASLPAWLADDRFWLVTPLLLDQQLFGFVCLAPPRAPVAVNWEVRDALRIAGRQAAVALALRHYASELATARQFASFNRMAAFVGHDLKNLAAQLALLLSNAERHRANPLFQDEMLTTSRHVLAKMQALLRKLHHAPGADAEEDAIPVALGAVLERAVQACAGRMPQPVLTLPAAPLTILAHPERLERVLGHLVLNAVEACAAAGSVTVSLQATAETALIAVTDTGHGMSPDFVRDRLFQPFETTKPAGMGIGAFEAREYVQQLGGSLAVSSTPGAGTRFLVTLRRARQENHDDEIEVAGGRG